jgi:acylphosphatase
MMIAAHILVRGMVQGVGFRYFVHMTAGELGLNGYVRNLFNGDVEIEVEGNRSLIEEFIKKVKVGPRSAHVSDLSIDWKEFSGKFRIFEIR